jgi:hypothetical protein
VKRFRFYAVIAIFIICVAVGVACVITASERARFISLGEEYSVADLQDLFMINAGN